ncbi:MAG TPA: GIY-YIG nuclease family protein [Holophaga sp.]|nr:GIY-YIG nuclease family protein [Holophaga sp.]HPS66647.1 GIY-YIG nuclease family protein [Holophaga sp.]
MPEPFDRKAALRAYKQRRPRPGIYAVKHVESGRAWPDSSPNLDTTKNGLWHRLDEGRHMDKTLQAEWDLWGPEAFEYTILEVVEEDMSPFLLKETLKSLKAQWVNRLGTRG